MDKIKITSKGQITIPIDIRKKLDLKEGMYLSSDVKDGMILLTPIEDDEKVALLKYAYRESQNSIGLSKVREMSKDLKCNMAKQVRSIRDREADGDGNE